MIDRWEMIIALVLLTLGYLFTLDKAVHHGFLKGHEDKFMIIMAYVGCAVGTIGLMLSFTS